MGVDTHTGNGGCEKNRTDIEQLLYYARYTMYGVVTLCLLNILDGCRYVGICNQIIKLLEKAVQ